MFGPRILVYTEATGGEGPRDVITERLALNEELQERCENSYGEGAEHAPSLDKLVD